MTNFEFLKIEPKFKTFADVTFTAEKILLLDPSSSILNCRRAMENAVKWIYSVDSSLELPWDVTLHNLMDTIEFRRLVDKDLLFRMNKIRKMGNDVAHSSKQMSKDQAILCLENLYIFLDFVSHCYSDHRMETSFDPELYDRRIKEIRAAKIEQKQLQEEQKTQLAESKIKLEELIRENESLRDELTRRREEQKDTYVPKPLEQTEYPTRKIYIDTLLQEVDWIEGKNWINEYPVPGMPNTSGMGYADYALLGDDGKVLAIIEAKRTCKDVAAGRQQARLYAKLIGEKQGRVPIIFLTNGFEIKIIDHQYPERRCAAFYSKRDLEKLFNLRSMRTSLSNISVDKDIAGRYYQEAAIKAVCDSFDTDNHRKALLVMATGSGKTRTVIALVKVLMEHGWIRDVLFLADRNSLVTQAKRSFVNLLPDLSVTNLVEEKDNYAAHCVFSTYQTMIHCIDNVNDENGILYTSGHFDLVICDEAHRSIYNKYIDIFNYFDAPLVGLTATPKDEVDKNTYEVFELISGIPTYGYELAQAVRDGYLVDYTSIETKLKFLQEGIAYDDLTDEEKEDYEDTFKDEQGNLPERLNTSALYQWIFNRDTVEKVLHTLMEHGIKIDYGNKLGKTIIFAKNHKHAEYIKTVFEEMYPSLPGYAEVIDNKINYAQSLIDQFSDPKKLPQIAISVDMMDTGIDVPEVVNLVFFKSVMSKAKFWQMIGRGTRLCPGLLDGNDKDQFYIFDFCGNFEFFRLNSKGKPAESTISLQGAIFSLEFELAYQLQDLKYQEDHLIAYRNSLVEHMVGKVQDLNRKHFAVRQHIKYVDTYKDPAAYQAIQFSEIDAVKEELAPLILPDPDDAKALRFDALMYGIQLAYASGKTYRRRKNELLRKVTAVSKFGTIPEVHAQKDFINRILHTDYLDHADINEFEQIREKLRDLMKYIINDHPSANIDYEDEILDVEWNESNLENDDLRKYKEKAEFYIRKHQDNIVIAKLKKNIPMTEDDLKVLENILWSEVGSKEDYEAEYGEKPLGEFVREIVGMDMNAAKEAFSEYLDETNLDSRQIYFVNQIVEYIVQNGMMKDLSILQEAPFNNQGSIVDIFTDLSVWFGIKKVIDQVNKNAVVA